MVSTIHIVCTRMHTPTARRLIHPPWWGTPRVGHQPLTTSGPYLAYHTQTQGTTYHATAHSLPCGGDQQCIIGEDGGIHTKECQPSGHHWVTAPAPKAYDSELVFALFARIQVGEKLNE